MIYNTDGDVKLGHKQKISSHCWLKFAIGRVNYCSLLEV